MGIDRDPKAIDFFKKSFCDKEFLKNRIILIHEKFSNLKQIELLKNKKIGGVLFDLGYSTAQVICLKRSILLNLL